IYSDNESAISPFIRRRQPVLGAHVSRCEELGSRIRPVPRRGKPIITDARISWLHSVIFGKVVEGDTNPDNVAILRTWSWLDSNFEDEVILGVRVGSL